MTRYPHDPDRLYDSERQGFTHQRNVTGTTFLGWCSWCSWNETASTLDLLLYAFENHVVGLA